MGNGDINYTAPPYSAGAEDDIGGMTNYLHRNYLFMTTKVWAYGTEAYTMRMPHRDIWMGEGIFQRRLSAGQCDAEFESYMDLESEWLKEYHGSF